MTKNLFKGLVLAGLVAGAAGCATTTVTEEDVNAVRAMAQEAQRTAEAAQASANAAQRSADGAMQEAQKVRQEARQCCEANSRRIERMFEESQKK